MKKFNDYEIRQIFLMKKMIDIFIKNNDKNIINRMHLYKLYMDTEALLRLITNLEQEWFEQMDSMRIELEIVDALAKTSDGHYIEFSKKDKKEIMNIVNIMSTKIDELIKENHLKEEDEFLNY